MKKQKLLCHNGAAGTISLIIDRAAGHLDVYIARAIETVLATGLVSGIIPYVAAIVFVRLLIATAANDKVKNCWIWVIGGVEYCIFRSLCRLMVAIHI